MESGRGKIIEEKSGDNPELSSDKLSELISSLDPTFHKVMFFGNAKLFDSVTLVALYVAYINNAPVRKLLAPYFLKSLSSCFADEIAQLVASIQPVSSETYRAIEKIGKTRR